MWNSSPDCCCSYPYAAISFAALYCFQCSTVYPSNQGVLSNFDHCCDCYCRLRSSRLLRLLARLLPELLAKTTTAFEKPGRSTFAAAAARLEREAPALPKRTKPEERAVAG